MTTSIHYPNHPLLPLEIVDRIFEDLTDDTTDSPHTSTLLACALTCKHYHAFAESHLYRNISIASSINGFKKWLPKSVIDVGKMVGILHERPHIARFVRKLDIFLHECNHDISIISHPYGPELITRLPWHTSQSDDTSRYRQAAFIKLFNNLGAHRLISLSIHSTLPEGSIHCLTQLSHSFAHAVVSLDQRSNIRTLVLERINAFPINSLMKVQNLTLSHSSIDTLLWPKFGPKVDNKPTLFPKHLLLKTRGIHSLYPLLTDDVSADASSHDRTVSADLSELEYLDMSFIGFEHQARGDRIVPYSLKEQAIMYMKICSIISTKSRRLKDLELKFLHEGRYTPALHFIQNNLGYILDSRDKTHPLQSLSLALDGINAPVEFGIWYDILRSIIDTARTTRQPTHVKSLRLSLTISTEDESLTGKSTAFDHWLERDIKTLSSMLGDKKLFATLENVWVEVIVGKGADRDELEMIVERLWVFESTFSRHLALGSVGFGMRVIAQS